MASAPHCLLAPLSQRGYSLNYWPYWNLTRYSWTCFNSLTRKTDLWLLSFPDRTNVNTTIILSKKFRTIHKIQDPGHSLKHKIQPYGGSVKMGIKTELGGLALSNQPQLSIPPQKGCHHPGANSGQRQNRDMWLEAPALGREAKLKTLALMLWASQKYVITFM